MGARNFLVEGVSGTGKTTVATELARRGHHVVHGDRELAVPGGTGHEDHRWDVDRVRALAADDHEPVTFFCGGSRNHAELLDLFEEVFVLHVDLATLHRRLDGRPGEFGHDPEERALVVRLHASGDDVPAGTPIDATRPVGEVVDELLRRADAPYVPRAGRLFVTETVDDTGTRLGRELAEAEQALDPRYTVEELHLEPGEDRRRDDVLVQRHRDGRRLMIHPPAVVVSDPVAIPRGRGRRLVVVRRRAELRAYPIGIVTASLRAARLPVADPLAPGPVTDPRHRAALLDLWALDDSAAPHESTRP